MDWSFAQRQCADVSRRGHDVFERYTNSLGVLTFLIADTSARGADRESLEQMLRWSFLTRAPRGIAPSDILGQVNKQFIYISRTSEEPVWASVFIGVIGTQSENNELRVGGPQYRITSSRPSARPSDTHGPRDRNRPGRLLS
jgi:hypothetical protein